MWVKALIIKKTAIKTGEIIIYQAPDGTTNLEHSVRQLLSI
jgi:hypothetical protein